MLDQYSVVGWQALNVLARKALSRDFMYYVYVLRSCNNSSKTYIGITQDLDARLLEHNCNTQPHTRVYSPWEIEAYVALSNSARAYKLEKYFKVGSGKAFLNKRILGVAK